MRAICGIDWASQWHDVRIADAQTGEQIVQRRFAHDEQGICALVDELVAFRVERVALERPDGLLVGRLLAAGLNVLAIHPNQVKAARDRFRAAAGKTDEFDSFVLCELARTDAHRFAALAPSGDETLALRALVRTREDLVCARVGLANQLRTQLDAFCPARRRSSPTSTARSRSPSSSATRAPPTRAAWVPSASKPSWTATATAADARSPSCSHDCAAPHSPSSASSKPTRAALPSAGSSLRCDRS